MENVEHGSDVDLSWVCFIFWSLGLRSGGECFEGEEIIGGETRSRL